MCLRTTKPPLFASTTQRRARWARRSWGASRSAASRSLTLCSLHPSVRPARSARIVTAANAPPFRLPSSFVVRLREGGRTARPARPPIRSTRLQRGVSSHREGGARAPIERPAARVALFPRPRFHARRTNHTTHPPDPPPVPFQPTTTATRRRRVRSDNGRQEIDTPFGKKTLQVFDLAASRALDVVFLAVDGDFALKWAEKIAEGAVERSPARVLVGASDRSVVGESASARARRVRFGCVAREVRVSWSCAGVRRDDNHSSTERWWWVGTVPAGDDGALVIDNSSAFRYNEKYPLMVPEINPEARRRASAAPRVLL